MRRGDGDSATGRGGLRTADDQRPVRRDRAHGQWESGDSDWIESGRIPGRAMGVTASRRGTIGPAGARIPVPAALAGAVFAGRAGTMENRWLTQLFPLWFQAGPSAGVRVRGRCVALRRPAGFSPAGAGFPRDARRGGVVRGDFLQKPDEVVPAEVSTRFAEQHPNVRLRLLESGHELTDVMDRMWAEAAMFLGFQNL